MRPTFCSVPLSRGSSRSSARRSGKLSRRIRNSGARVTDIRQIIAFRNLLIHAYASVSPSVVWGVIEEELPTLLAEAESLLAAEGS